MEEEASAELISPRISFSHDLATFATTTTTTTRPEPSRRDTSFLLSPRRRRRVPEPEFDFANAAADDVAPADRLFADGKLLPVPPLPPTPPAHRIKQPHPPVWQKTTTRPPPPAARSWASPFARSSSVNSAATASSGGRFTWSAFPLMRSQSAGHRPHCKKVAPATAATTTAAGVHNGGVGGVGARSVYYYGYRGSRNGSASGGVRVSPVLNVTSIGTSVVNMLSYLLCDCGEIKGGKSRGVGVSCWVTR